MLAVECLFLKGAIESTGTKELINIFMEHLKDIKDSLQLLKMIVVELQKRNEK